MSKEILNSLANMVSLLGGKPEIVKLIRQLDAAVKVADAQKELSDYNMELTTSVKDRLANVSTQKVNPSGYRLN